MLEGIDINKREEYSSEKDTSKPKTVFVLKPLTASQFLNTMKYFDAEGKKFEFSGEYVFSMLTNSIVEIKNPNIKDKDKILEFLDSLEPSILLELSTKISTSNKFSDEESKN